MNTVSVQARFISLADLLAWSRVAMSVGVEHHAAGLPLERARSEKASTLHENLEHGGVPPGVRSFAAEL